MYRRFEVHVARDGREGLIAMLRWAPDLVLCDIIGLTVSSVDLLELLTTVAPRFGRVPLVLLIAAAGRPSRVGRSDFSPKSAAPKDSEIWVLTRAARGHTAAKIAELLGLSKETVDFHMDNARIKLGAVMRIEAVTKALFVRLIEPHRDNSAHSGHPQRKRRRTGRNPQRIGPPIPAGNGIHHSVCCDCYSCPAPSFAPASVALRSQAHRTSGCRRFGSLSPFSYGKRAKENPLYRGRSAHRRVARGRSDGSRL